jgi:hypothetical protein
LEEGGEADTLQDLYEFCLERPNDTVVYLHDKGSFNRNAGNNRIRKIATSAALADGCVEGISKGCNICSGLFNVYHYIHTAGNMFVAKCSYIQGLIPPKEFELRRLQMFHYILSNSTVSDSFSCLRETLLEGRHTDLDSAKLLGTGRYR